jgi:hypothetical protein
MGLHQPALVKCAPTALTTPRPRFDDDRRRGSGESGDGLGFATQLDAEQLQHELTQLRFKVNRTAHGWGCRFGVLGDVVGVGITVA